MIKIIPIKLLLELTANQHDTNGEDLLTVRIRRYVAKTDTCQTAKRKVERGDIL